MMFSTQGSIASRSFDFDFSEMVVVGHVPLNRKRGQKQLKKIAQQNEVTSFGSPDRRDRTEHSRSDRKKAQQPKEHSRSERKNTQQPKDSKPRNQPPKERTRQPKAFKPVSTQPLEIVAVPKQEAKQSKAVAKIVVGASAAYVQVLELPQETLSGICGLAGFAALGNLVATGRAAHGALWAAGPARDFWRGLGADGWNHCRVLRFGLASGWTLRLEEQALESPLEALETAVRVCGALLVGETAEAAGVLAALAAASHKAEPKAALALLDQALPKLRPEVFGCVATVQQARDEACERAILADIDQQQQREHEAMAFDYFAEPAALPAPGAFWDELEALTPAAPKGDVAFFDEADEEDEVEAAPAIPEATSRALAAEFLEAMGLRHGLEWQETAAAMTA